MAAGVKSWQFRRAVIEQMLVSGRVIRGATGSGVVFGQSVFHVDRHCPKTTPDPFRAPPGGQIPNPGRPVLVAQRRTLAAALFLEDTYVTLSVT
jgi:hypothetical protein